MNQNYLLGYTVCLRAAVAANDVGISLQDGATEKLYDVIGVGSPPGTRCVTQSELPIIVGTADTAMSLIVAAAGPEAIVEVSIWGYTV
jgi:hypothetical protein